MKITFLGTRGYIESSTRLHKRHTSTLFSYHNTHILIDRGIDWLGQPYPKSLRAIFITHAHPDHAWGLQSGAPCEVYASRESWELMKDFTLITQRQVVIPRKKIKIGEFIIEPFFEEHSIRCPALGYRITAGKHIIFYSGDVVFIPQYHEALQSVQLYIGDGASLIRPIIRKTKDGKLFGHAPISTQLTWCKKENVPRAIFTHCGSQIVEADGRSMGAKVRQLGKMHGIIASIAHDGMELIL